MLGFFNPNQENVIAATRQLLRLLQVPVTHTTIQKRLKEHPHYPSLLSIMDSLVQWKVESIGIQAQTEQLVKFPTPFIAHIVENKHNLFTVVRDINKDRITYYDLGQSKLITSSLLEFSSIFNGTVMLADIPNSSSGRLGEAGEPDYRKKHRVEIMHRVRIQAAFFIVLVLTGLTAFSSGRIQELFPLLLGLVGLVGIIVTSLLLWYEIDKKSPVLQKICAAGKHTNCSAILNSGAAKLWGILTWSEIGFAYFTGAFLSLLLSDFSPVIIEIVAWLNLLAIPYVFFSVFYQWRVVKQWCALCLSVQSLLLVEFIICFTGKYYTLGPKNVSLHDVIILAIAYLLPLFLWRQIKPLWLNAKSGKRYKQQLFRLKHDRRIFEALLPQQKEIYPEDIENLGITLGYRHAKYKLIKVCNPYCGPCAKAHPEIEAIIENNPEISAQIIFTATDDEKDLRSVPVKHLMAIDEKGNEEETKRALDDWYSAPKKEYNLFAKKYPLGGELQQQDKKLKAMSDWCNKTGISFTPTFFLSLPSPPDGGEDLGMRQMPDIYSIEDLKYLLK